MCGFISIYGPEGADVIQDVLSGLLAIQHRGQDAAGVVTFGEKFQAKKGLGLVREVFQAKHLTRLRGPLAVGHVRYPTVGMGEDTDVQPFWMDFPVSMGGYEYTKTPDDPCVIQMIHCPYGETVGAPRREQIREA